MYSFGPRSKAKLALAHKDLVTVCEEVIKYVDFAVIESVRGKEKQDYLFSAGLSKVEFPNSKHNASPSLAIDVVPWPIDWKDHKRFYYLAGLMIGVAKSKNINLRFGGDWDKDGDITDNPFLDLGHYEIY